MCSWRHHSGEPSQRPASSWRWRTGLCRIRSPTTQLGWLNTSSGLRKWGNGDLRVRGLLWKEEGLETLEWQRGTFRSFFYYLSYWQMLFLLGTGLPSLCAGCNKSHQNEYIHLPLHVSRGPFLQVRAGFMGRNAGKRRSIPITMEYAVTTQPIC